jgi:mono/diheme cytochrome c family protein
MRTPLSLTFLLYALLLLTPSFSWAGETDQGRELYLKHCSSCHGKDGQGKGSVSPFLKIKVPDLTLLKKNNKGIYPLDKVMTSIDGSRAVRGHGDGTMPVWGEIFEKQAKESDSEKYPKLTSLLQVRAIAEYIGALQR